MSCQLLPNPGVIHWRTVKRIQYHLTTKHIDMSGIQVRIAGIWGCFDMASMFIQAT